MELGLEELPAHEIAAALAAARQPLYYLAPGGVAARPSMRASTVPARVLLISHPGRLADLQAAQRAWCAAAELELEEQVSRLDPAALLRPLPGSRWAAVPAERRAALLSRAIDLVSEHAAELAVFDEEELGARIDGVATEHIFLGLVAHRAEREDLEVIVLAPGDDDRWLLRTVFTVSGRLWGRGVVLAPPGALAGIELAAVAAHVILRGRGRVHGEGGPVDPRAPAEPVAPALAAALQAGAMVLTPRITSLIPPSRDALLH